MKMFDYILKGKNPHTDIVGANIPITAILSIDLLLQNNKSTIIVCNDNTTVETFYSDIRAILLSKNTIKPIFDLYDWQKDPHTSSILPSQSSLQKRLKSLISISKNNEPSIYIVNYNALALRTLQKETLISFSFSLNKKTDLSPQELKEKLLSLGFEQREAVIDPGTFSVRGDIVDLFLIDKQYPIRLDFFDTTIESWRYFDPKTQLSIDLPQKLNQEIIIFQAKEALINSHTLPCLKKRIKKFCDDRFISKKIRDEIFEKTEIGIYPELAPFWSSFLYENTTATFSYFPENAHLIFFDHDRILSSHETNATLKKGAKDQKILPPKEVMYENNSDFMKNHNCIVVNTILNSHSSAQKPQVFSIQAFTEKPPVLFDGLKKLCEDGFNFFVFCDTQSEQDKIIFLLSSLSFNLKFFHFITAPLSESFYLNDEKIAFLTTETFFSNKRFSQRAHIHNSSSIQTTESVLFSLNDLSENDAIVHISHGIGIYKGLKRLSLGDAETDCLLIEYHGGDKLYLPVDRMNLIQKHSRGDGGVRVSKLGSSAFENTKKRVRAAVKEIAFSLINLYAKRHASIGPKVEIDQLQLGEFESLFPFQETPDQSSSIEDIIKDFRSGRVMDRVICGDVGFGKTEVAMRACFLAVHSGFQVVVLVPTTVLCLQHERTFKVRFENTGITIDSISRFKNKSEQKETIKNLALGNVDIIIGTHRILSKDIKLKNLGLLIIDEEHRFGVEHKEMLKNIKTNTHSLTLTATPIPRTLQMALTGVRDLSIIQTPPKERLPIQTYVSRYNTQTISDALEFELARDGQVIFLHNKVSNIFKIAEDLRKLRPNALVDVAHGQMPEKMLEEKILSFFKKKTNVLVCTTIIESGIDIPSANTLIVNRADTLGLSQLYQIRGRVGRGDKRAFAYLLIPERGELSLIAQQRLEVIQKHVDLGSGFKIATHDLDLRGGGNILGAEQSGHIDSVGIELYLDLLKEAVDELGETPSETPPKKIEVELKIPYPSYFDEKFISDIQLRLKFYKKLSLCTNEVDVDLIEHELQDRFGKIPEEALNLLWVIRLKIILKDAAVSSLLCSHERISLSPTASSALFTPERALRAVSLKPDLYQLTPDSKFIIIAKNKSVKKLYAILIEHLHELSQI